MEPSFNKPDLSQETIALREAWMRHDDAFLKDYLISDVEDPRIHFPSIFTRGMIAEALFPEKFRELMWEEYRFGICMSYMRRVFQQRPSSGTPKFLLEALKQGDESFQAIPLPAYMHASWQQLNASRSDSNYIAACLEQGVSGEKAAAFQPELLNTFQHRWRDALSDHRQTSLKVMEPACGSANDYRFLHSFGLGACIDYEGFDICPKNISNARGMFPDIRFNEGSVFEVDAQDRTVDFLYVHDLFEHLSIAGMERGLDELCRVTRGTACLCFFNMAERADHLVQPKEGYHWNRLSLEKIIRFLDSRCEQLQVIHTASFLHQAFACNDYHNAGSYALVLDFHAK